MQKLSLAQSTLALDFDASTKHRCCLYGNCALRQIDRDSRIEQAKSDFGLALPRIKYWNEIKWANERNSKGTVLKWLKTEHVTVHLFPTLPWDKKAQQLVCVHLLTGRKTTKLKASHHLASVWLLIWDTFNAIFHPFVAIRTTVHFSCDVWRSDRITLLSAQSNVRVKRKFKQKQHKPNELSRLNSRLTFKANVQSIELLRRLFLYGYVIPCWTIRA